MTEDDINKIETLIGWVEAAGKGLYPFGEKYLIDGAEEASEWIQEIKQRNNR